MYDLANTRSLMKHTRAQRNSIKAWRQKLLALNQSVDTGDVNRDLLELHALDIAMIESGIYGLLALVKNHATSQIVKDILRDILSSHGDPTHWRNIEGRPAIEEDNARPGPKSLR